ncbi:MAG: carbohydrate-binding protein, partial [Kiritimatiellaceae bacterium]|nr:carbohydrate-binding protein [Kiritimatiellaceae bacterium]
PFVSVDWNNFDVVNNAGLVQRIEAERYASNTGFVSQVTSDTGGGTNMSCSAAGATMTYPVTISPSSAFNILARVASSNTPIQFDLKNGTNVICSVDRTTTGGNQVWVTTTNTVYLPEGSMTLSLQAKSGFNVNWLEFQPIGNVAPVITSTPELGADVGSLYQYAMTASDLEGDALTFSSLTLPSWLSLDSSSGVLSGTPPVDQMGSHPVVLQVSDASNSSTQSFSIWVSSASNEVPVITSTPETGVIVSNGYSYTLSATDGDLHTLSYSVLTKPSWLGFDSVTRVLSGTPASSNVGSHAIGFAVTDGRVTVTQQFSLVVFPIQPANLVQNPSFELGTTNVSGWTTGGTATNVFVAAHGSRSLRIQTPVGSTTPTRQSIPVTAGTVYSYSVWINAAGITTSAVVFDTGIAGSGKVVVSNNTGWTKYSGSVTSATTSLSLRLSPLATNFGGVAYIDHIILTAGTLPVNAPVITSIPETNAAPQNLFSYRLLATDANNEPLTFTGVTVPSWLSFNTNSGVLSGTPTGADVGNHPVVLSVRNGSLSVTQSFTIAVTSIPLANRYAEWAAVEGVGAPNEDDDHDGRSNFYEYTLFGSPMNTNNLGIEPTAEKVANELEYKHWMRNDDSNLIYTVQMTTNLLFDGWTNAGIPAEIVGTNGPYHQLKYRIPMQTPGSYIRLKVTD